MGEVEASAVEKESRSLVAGCRLIAVGHVQTMSVLELELDLESGALSLSLSLGWAVVHIRSLASRN